MRKINWTSKRLNYILMTILVIAWGYEYIAAKSAMETVMPITLVFFKYLVAFAILMVYKLLRDRRFPFKKRDIPFFFLCAIFGDIMYFAGEYGAMHYIPISLVTIILAFVPAVSILLEFAIFKVRPTPIVVAGIVACILGVGLVVGADFSALANGRMIGYLLAFLSVISWNIYNFITARLTGNYNPIDLTIYQLAAALIVALPYAVFNMPEASAYDAGLILSVLYLAIASSCFGFIVYVNSVRSLGVTPSALFSNMLPVTSTFFGWLCLGEMIAPIQIIGGVIVVAAGSLVIYMKGKGENDITRGEGP
jgi:drug/metabolite transporter (DMT)-like permease